MNNPGSILVNIKAEWLYYNVYAKPLLARPRPKTIKLNSLQNLETRTFVK